MGFGWLEYGLRTIYIFVLAKFLGPELYGFWAYGLAVYGLIVGLVSFGIESLIPLRIGTDKASAPDYLGLTLAIRFILMGIAVGALTIYAFASESEKTSLIVLLLLIPAVVGRGLSFWARTCFLSYERVGDLARYSAAIRIAEAGIGIALLFVGAGLFSIVILHSVSWLIEGVVGLSLTRSRLAKWTLQCNRRDATDFLRQGAVLGLAAALMTWLAAGPLVLLRHYSDTAAQVGQLAIPLNFTLILVASAQSYLATALPVLSRSSQRQDPRLALFSALVVAAGGFVSVAAGIVGLLFGQPVLVWALGPAYQVAGALLGPVLFISGLIIAPTGYAQLLLLRGYRWHGVFANGCGGLVLILGLPTAFTLWNLYGAAAIVGLAWFSRATLLIAFGLILPGKEAVAEAKQET